ncbi:cyclin-dependent kinase inhibitor 3 family protein [Caenimonas soli]|uniref:cyclin-dependent kinase inhibitor 3 family protein n=1 Tax=Caenimonas soli TaxID=2735555 RepID=UPI001557FFFF|nr:cyclin-dependent kinase inhibitor 3 family protein [Caenimonas soli]NPC56677.1 phosphatase [Caenimonas soli]
MTARTSTTDPLRIVEIACEPWASGIVGITFCPGKRGDSVFGSPWQRDLDIDLDAVTAWGADVALTLVEQHELRLLQVPTLGEGFRKRGIDWYHLPIVDLSTPDQAFHRLWLSAGAVAVRSLRKGKKVLVHCRGGRGRAGTVAVALLIELGENPQRALQKVRAARPGAVETEGQERYLATYTRLLEPKEGG